MITKQKIILTLEEFLFYRKKGGNLTSVNSKSYQGKTTHLSHPVDSILTNLRSAERIFGKPCIQCVAHT